MNKKDYYIHKFAERFFSNINHEIRTPLNAIMGFSELLKTTHTDKKDMFLDMIIENGRLLLRFIDHLIYLSQVQSGIITPKNNTININQFLKKIFDNTINQHYKIKKAEHKSFLNNQSTNE